MRFVRNLAGEWRSRLGVAILVLVAATGAAGIAFAATGSSGSALITACANADQVLSLSTTGGCPQGDTLVQWNQQGIQGPQGPQGLEGPPGPPGPQGTPGASANGAVLAWGPSSYKDGFSIRAEITKPGKYWMDGSVFLNLDSSTGHKVVCIDQPCSPLPAETLTPSCHLLAGPPNQGASDVGSWSDIWRYYPNGGNWVSQLPYHGQIEATSDVLNVTSPPLELYLSCSLAHSSNLLKYVHPVATWIHPTITIETYTPPSGPGKLVGAALPNQPHIGPGTIIKVFGGG